MSRLKLSKVETPLHPMRQLLNSYLGKLIFFYDINEELRQNHILALELLVSRNNFGDPELASKLFYLCIFTNTPFLIFNALTVAPYADLYGLSSFIHFLYTLTILKLFVMPSLIEISQSVQNNTNQPQADQPIIHPSWTVYKKYKQNILRNLFPEDNKQSRTAKYEEIVQICNTYAKELKVDILHIWSCLTLKEDSFIAPCYCFAFCKRREVYVLVGSYDLPEHGFELLINFPGRVIISTEEIPSHSLLLSDEQIVNLKEKLENLKKNNKQTKLYCTTNRS
eukprot:snap_masked-scaffold_3-processed-gene-11.13-mRNA-1 protein AED:1.00 eAED:1.00 QI:0/0/0/0/1/1/2/0/280